MPPAVTLIELCDLANRVLANGSGNTATILDPLTERSGILAAQAAEVDLPGPAQPPGNRKAEGAQRPASGTNEIAGDRSLKVWARLTSEGSYAATCMPGSALKGSPPSSDQPQRPLSTNVTRVCNQAVTPDRSERASLAKNGTTSLSCSSGCSSEPSRPVPERTPIPSELR